MIRRKSGGDRAVKSKQSSRHGLPRAEDTLRGTSELSPSNRDGQGTYNKRACVRGRAGHSASVEAVALKLSEQRGG